MALRVLEDKRWQVGHAPLFDSALTDLAKWADAVAAAQWLEGMPLPVIDRALLSYGLEGRLRTPALAKAALDYSLSETKAPIADLDAYIVADDPYLVDAFSASGFCAGSKAVHVRNSPGTVPYWKRIREQAVSSLWLRRLEQRCAWSGGRRSHLSSSVCRGKGHNTAAVFVLGQRFLDLFLPVQQALEGRGWHVQVFYYNPLREPSPHATAFSDAAKESGCDHREAFLSPRWMLDEAMLGECPVSRDWLIVALKASWSTGSVQKRRHRCVLEAGRPDVVISFGPDIMSLALQAAADACGIPSVFLPHGFLCPVPASRFLHATASALVGTPCITANAANPFGLRTQSLVATGHPNYDDMLREAIDPEAQSPRILRDLLPVHRPHLVVAFAEWANDLLGHLMQRRALEMVAAALPDDAFLICKLHPSWEEREMCDTVLRAHLPADAFRVVSDREYSTAVLLADSRVVVLNERSMCLTDAIVMGRPAVSIMHAEYPRGSGDLNHPAKTASDACWRVSNSAELHQALCRLLHEPGARQALLKKRKAYIEEFLVASDGRACERVVGLVEHLRGGGDPASFLPSRGPSLLGEG